jgi:hypothetical protein
MATNNPNDPIKKMKSKPAANMGAPKRTVQGVKPDYNVVGTMDDYFGKTKVRYQTESGAMREFKPSTSYQYYKDTGKVLAMSNGSPVTFEGDKAKKFMENFHNQAGMQREKDYNAMMKKMGPGMANIASMLSGKNKSGVIKPKQTINSGGTMLPEVEVTAKKSTPKIIGGDEGGALTPIKRTDDSKSKKSKVKVKTKRSNLGKKRYKKSFKKPR